MNRTELEQRLRDEGIRQDLYSLDGSNPYGYEGLVLDERGGEWIILHFERGIRSELFRFASEGDACARMYEELQTHFRW